MADADYLSGYDGTITLTGTGAPKTNIALESWVVRQRTEEIQAFAKGDAWKTKFGTASEWSATIVFLLQEAFPAASEGLTNATVDPAEFINKSGTTDQAWVGVGFISSFEVENPIDGPDKVTAEITGTGALVPTTYSA